MRIDAHQHFWKLARNDYGWITPDMSVLYRDFLPEDLLPALQKLQIDKTILVQAAPTHEETEFMLALSEQTNTIAGVVGWLDLHDSSYQERFNHLVKHPKFVGFRVMIQEMEDASIVLQPEFLEALSFFASIDFPVDLLVLSHQLPVVVDLLNQVSGLRGVIDHLAKPEITAGKMEPWKGQMQEIANHPNIYCKLSGMVTEADHKNWTREQLVPYVHHILSVFGTERVMFGSDWPVCLQAASYDEVYESLKYCLPDQLTEREHCNIFGGNAQKFYKLNPACSGK